MARNKETTKKATTSKKTTSKTVPTKRPNQKSFKGAFIGMSVLSFLLLGGLAYPVYLAVTNTNDVVQSKVDLSEYNLKSKSILKTDIGLDYTLKAVVDTQYNKKNTSVDVSDKTTYPNGVYTLTQSQNDKDFPTLAKYDPINPDSYIEKSGLVDGTLYLASGSNNDLSLTKAPVVEPTLNEKIQHFTSALKDEPRTVTNIVFTANQDVPVKDILNKYLSDGFKLNDEDVNTIFNNPTKYKFSIWLGHQTEATKVARVTNWDGAEYRDDVNTLEFNNDLVNDLGFKFNFNRTTKSINLGDSPNANGAIRFLEVYIAPDSVIFESKYSVTQNYNSKLTSVDVSDASFVNGGSYTLVKDGTKPPSLTPLVTTTTLTLDDKIALLNDYNRIYDLSKKIDTGFTNRSLLSLLNIGLTDEQKFTTADVTAILTDSNYTITFWVGDRRAFFIDNLYRFPTFTNLSTTTQNQLRFDTPDTYYSFFLTYTRSNVATTPTTPASASATITLTSNNQGTINFAGAFRGMFIHKTN